MKLVGLAAIGVVASIAFAAPASAEIDTDFANELHTYGIYGPRDRNAWIGKLTCKRLHNGIDHDAQQSVIFAGRNLDKGVTTVQSWQFVGTAINYYCPDLRPVMERAAAQSAG